MRAMWNGVVIADSDDTVVVEGNHYFPVAALDATYLSDSATRSLCPWKGVAHYRTVSVAGVSAPDAAWFYPRPFPLARKVKGRVAFWRGVRVEPSPAGAADRSTGRDG
jgi:uncharacterized protein (DUF427 family)